MTTILFIGHDANRAGAQLVLLHLLRRLHETGRFRLRLLLGEGGPLLSDYQAIADVVLWPAAGAETPIVSPFADKVLDKLGLWQGMNQRRQTARQHAFDAALGLDSVQLVLVNTITSGRWFRQLTLPARVPVITFVHELAMAVRMYTRPDDLAFLLGRTNHLLAVSQATADYYVTQHGFDPARITLFTLIDIPDLNRRIAEARAGADPYPALGLPPDALVVGGCGNAEWRKGNDLFVTLARLTLAKTTAASGLNQPVYFVWVGMPPGDYADQLQMDIDKAGLTDRVRLLPPTPDVLRYASRFTIFALTSREDPYPLVVFEAGLSGVPVVCFAGAGGAPELVGTDGGAVIPYLDLNSMSSHIAEMLKNPTRRQQLGRQLAGKIRHRHPIEQSVEVLIQVISERVNK